MKKLPKYFQIGTIISGRDEGSKHRIKKKDFVFDIISDSCDRFGNFELFLINFYLCAYKAMLLILKRLGQLKDMGSLNS